MDKPQLIRLIHVAKRQLNMNDSSYRANLKLASGKTSCRHMTLAELMQALEQFKQLGFTIKAKAGQRRNAATPPRPTQGKIRAVWITMANHMVIADGSDAALNAYVRRMTKRRHNQADSTEQGVDSIAWLSDAQARRVLESLKNWHRRELIDRIRRRGDTPATRNGKVAGYQIIVAQYQDNAHG